MVNVDVFRSGDAPGMSCQFPEGYTVGEFFCKDFMAFPISPVWLLVNGQAPSLKDCLHDGDKITYLAEPEPKPKQPPEIDEDWGRAEGFAVK
ncbi:MAG: hypothetical protein GXY54_09095 [Deltaproteobacteria bacterium]|nr:hypothetical protein [Deltaproteobacteria bacterium]